MFIKFNCRTSFSGSILEYHWSLHLRRWAHRETEIFIRFTFVHSHFHKIVHICKYTLCCVTWLNVWYVIGWWNWIKFCAVSSRVLNENVLLPQSFFNFQFIRIVQWLTSRPNNRSNFIAFCWMNRNVYFIIKPPIKTKTMRNQSIFSCISKHVLSFIKTLILVSVKLFFYRIMPLLDLLI